MVRKKITFLAFIVIVLLIFSWLITAITVVTGDAERSQNMLLGQAQGYMDDKLYMRAIPKYQEAVNTYHTEKNSDIEIMILETYKEAGKLDIYYNLIEDRIEEHKAQTGEYLELARMYTDSGNIKKAIETLKAGIAQYDDAQMKAQYEEIRYGIKVLETNMTELKLPGSGGYIPYWDGAFWGYASSSARPVLTAQYEEALPFSGKYAVVKLEGVYTLIDINGDWYAIDKLGLEEVTGTGASRIVGKQNGKYGVYTNTFNQVTGAVYEDAVISANGLCFVKQNGKWGLIDSNGEEITDFIYDDIAVNSRNEVFASGYAVVKDSSGYFIINEEGKELSPDRYAQAKGMEGSWVAVADQSGRWGFTDGTGGTVIDYIYEDACSFSCGVAAVKQFDKWGYISKNNKLVIEAKYEDAMPFQEGKGIVRKMGTYSFLTFQYYEYF